MEGKAMAKYLALFEVDTSKTPDDAKSRKAQWLAAQEMVLKKLKEGAIKEWGGFAGELGGYIIVEGSAVDLHAVSALWFPLVKFTTKEILTIDEVHKVTKALPE
jgi:hypothetical protein